MPSRHSADSFRPWLPFVLAALAACASDGGGGSTSSTTTGTAGSGAAGNAGSGGVAGSGTSESGGTSGSGGSGGASGAGATGGSGGASGAGETGGSGGDATGSGGSTGGSSGTGGSTGGSSGQGGSQADASTAKDSGISMDPQPEAGPRTACPPGVVLCDDFESYPANSAPTKPWTTTTKSSGKAVVDAMHAYSGTKAVHFSGSVNRDEAYIRASGAPVFPVAGPHIFVRFMMYVQQYPNANPMHVRFSWVGTTGVSQNQQGSGYTMCTYNGVAIERIASGYLRDATQAMTQSTNQNKWVCWEYEISNDEGPAAGEGGTVLPRIWREGQALSLKMAGTKENWNPASFDLVQFSLFAYQSDSAVANYWFDDIAVSTTRIGCPAANPAAK